MTSSTSGIVTDVPHSAGRSVKAAMDWIGDSIDRADDYLRDEMEGVLNTIGDVGALQNRAAAPGVRR